jgi:hypothetical protein
VPQRREYPKELSGAIDGGTMSETATLHRRFAKSDDTIA